MSSATISQAMSAIVITHCDLVTPYGEIDLSWTNVDSGNSLLLDDTKPLPEPMLTNHQWGPVTSILGWFHKRYLSHQSLKAGYFCDIRVRAIFYRMPQQLFCIRSLKNILYNHCDIDVKDWSAFDKLCLWLFSAWWSGYSPTKTRTML